MPLTRRWNSRRQVVRLISYVSRLGTVAVACFRTVYHAMASLVLPRLRRPGQLVRALLHLRAGHPVLRPPHLGRVSDALRQ
jgi:hypothetical protein